MELNTDNPIKFHSIKSRVARKEHICHICGDDINKDQSYSCITVKRNHGKPEETFDNIKLHFFDCLDRFLQDKVWIHEPKEIPVNGVEAVAFQSLLSTIFESHKRWDLDNYNSLFYKYKLMKEKNEKFYQSAKKKESDRLNENLGDLLAVALSNILWINRKIEEDIHVHGVLNNIESKLKGRAKFGYKLKNVREGGHKMIDWNQALHLLEEERNSWKVISGPKHIHPEIRELLSRDEIEWLEKTGT